MAIILNIDTQHLMQILFSSILSISFQDWIVVLVIQLFVLLLSYDEESVIRSVMFFLIILFFSIFLIGYLKVSAWLLIEPAVIRISFFSIMSALNIMIFSGVLFYKKPFVPGRLLFPAIIGVTIMAVDIFI